MTEPAVAAAGPEPKLRIDKLVDGGIVCLKFVGTIDEQFEGKKLAATIKAETLVLDLAGVNKISSFGIREWVDFVDGAAARTGTMLLVECAPKVIDQLNMVMNFAGRGRVFSFYAPYRCDYCDTDRRQLFQMDRDIDAIRALKAPERPCPACGNPEYLDEDPVAFFSYLSQQPPVELSPAVATFLAARLHYAVAEAARRMRVEKHVDGRSTYLRLTGDLDAAFPAAKIAEGLEGTVIVDLRAVGQIDPAGAAEWARFLGQIGPACERILLAGCPPVFVERLARPDDLGKARVLSFTMPYTCARCAITAGQLVDVDQHHDLLQVGTPPPFTCGDCRAQLRCVASDTLLMQLPTMARPEVRPELRKFLRAAQSLSDRKPRRTEAARPQGDAPGRGLWLPVAAALVLGALLAGGAVLGLSWKADRDAARRVEARDAAGKLLRASAPARPPWVTFDTRGYAACRDEGGQVACLGVSSFGERSELARAEAIDAALDELASHVALGIDDPRFRASVLDLYGRHRQSVLAALSAARGDGRSEASDDRYRKAREAVRDRRHAVAEAIRRHAGTAIPAQPAAEYREEYQAPEGQGHRYLVFVRYVLGAAELRALRARYAAPATALGAQALPAFPALAWRYPEVTQGAVVVTLAPGPLRDIGLAPQDVILEVQGKKIEDAAAFAASAGGEYERLGETGGALRLLVQSGDGEPRLYSLNVARRAARDDDGDDGARRRTTGTGRFSGGVNIWDQTGGGAVRDDPNE